MTLPVLLSGHTMTPAGQISPLSFGLSLKADGLSTATMVLNVNSSPVLTLGAWVKITAPMGHNSGVFYVKSIQTDCVTGLYTVTLEHTFGLLQEMIAFGEITPETIGGAGATTVNISTAINYLLGYQTEQLWQLDQNDFSSISQGWKFTHQDIYNALSSITDSVPDCQWEFDQTTLPWKLSLKAFPSTATMELRKNRNIETMKISIDRSQMYTRVYPTGKNNLHIDSVNNGQSYLDQNTATWGVVAKVITDSSVDNAGLLKSWAAAELNRHSTPAVSVNVGGLELSAATGESLDSLVLGRKCRIPLPDYNTIVTERIVELSWKDCILSEEQVTVTLANELRTIQGVLYEIARGGGGGGSKSNISKDCELEETEEKLEEFDNSDIWINRDSIWAVCGAYTVYTDAHGTKVLRMKEGGALTIMRNNVELALYDEGNLSGGIIVNRINGQSGPTSVKISASMIELDGQAIASLLQSQSIDCSGLHAEDISCNHTFTYKSSETTWVDKTVVTGVTVTMPSITLSYKHHFKYDDDGVTGSVNAYVITAYSAGSASVNTEQISYIGEASNNA